MPCFRPLAYSIGGIILLGWVVIYLARADEDKARPSQPAEGVTAVLEAEGGASQKGTIPRTLAINTEYGRLELALEKVKDINFVTEGGQTRAMIELLSQHHLHGTPEGKALALTKADGTTEQIPFSALRKLDVERPAMNLSLVGAAIGLVTLAVMEIVLGVDNIIFLAIIVGRLPKEQQPRARKIGLFAALGTRIMLLFSLTWLLGLTKPVFTLPITGLTPDARDISWRDMILLAGGAFLIVKSVMEMHHKLTESRAPVGGEPPKVANSPSFAKIIFQIAVIDIVFSLDSVITAVGMVDSRWVMIAAMVLAMLVMLWFSGPLSNFVDRHPTVKVLALSFLILIGVLLVAEGLGQHLDKAYVYFAMAFGVGVELINIMLKPKGLTKYIVG